MAKNASEKMVEYFVPRATGDEPKELVISVNGKRWSLPRGTKVTIPLYIAEEARRAVYARDNFFSTVDELLEKASAIQGANNT